MLKLGGCTGGTTSTLPTGYQREPSLGSQVSMLLLAVPAIVLPTGLTRRSTATSAVSQPNQPLSSAASRPELVRHPTCTLPIGLPSFSRVPWHTGTWQCVASRRLVWSPSVVGFGPGPMADQPVQCWSHLAQRGPMSPALAGPRVVPPRFWRRRSRSNLAHNGKTPPVAPIFRGANPLDPRPRLTISPDCSVRF